jgi:hypothetical protein
VPVPLAVRAHAWLGQLARQARQTERARQHLEAAVRLGGQVGSAGVAGVAEQARRARLDLADLDLEGHRYLRALAAYRRLAADAGPALRPLADQRVVLARTLLGRFVVLLASLAALAGFVVQALWRHARQPPPRARLWPPPEEVRYFVPVALLLILAARGRDENVVRTLCYATVQVVVLLVLNALALGNRPPDGQAARAGYLALLMMASAAALYVAVYAADLLPILTETLQHGLEG